MEIEASLNIFDYATSELSQDAFLFWFINQCKNDDDSILREFSKKFILKIITEHNAAHPDKVRFDGNLDDYILTNHKQEKHSDVVVCFRHKDESKNFNDFTLLIEDKVFSGDNKYDQLLSYKKELSKKFKQIIPLYFKTGYESDSDITEHKKKYLFLSYEDIHGFFSEYSSDNIILKSWYDVFYKNIYKPIKKAEKFCFADKTLSNFFEAASGSDCNSWILFIRLSRFLKCGLRKRLMSDYPLKVNGKGHVDYIYELWGKGWNARETMDKGGKQICGNNKINMFCSFIWGSNYRMSLFFRTYPKAGYQPRKKLTVLQLEEYNKHKQRITGILRSLSLEGWKARNSYMLRSQYDLPANVMLSELRDKISEDFTAIEKELYDKFLSRE